MRLARAVAAASVAVAACYASSTPAFVVGAAGTVFASSSVRTTPPCSTRLVGTYATSTLGSTHDRQRHSPQHTALALRAGASDAEEEEGEGGGFPNPYTAFRKWQMELVSGFTGIGLNDSCKLISTFY